MRYYYTFDSEGDKIAENAEILAIEAESEDAAQAEILKELSNSIVGLEPDESLTLVEGRFGDCWIKLYYSDSIEQEGAFDPFTRDQIHVGNPGTHPGGKAWWITPLPKIFCLEIKTSKES